MLSMVDHTHLQVQRYINESSKACLVCIRPISLTVYNLQWLHCYSFMSFSVRMNFQDLGMYMFQLHGYFWLLSPLQVGSPIYNLRYRHGMFTGHHSNGDRIVAFDGSVTVDSFSCYGWYILNDQDSWVFLVTKTTDKIFLTCFIYGFFN